MRAWFNVVRTPRYERDIQDVYDYIEQDNADAAIRMLLHIEDRVDSLADPNFPRRKGRVKGTLELVAHPNYLVVLKQTEATVTVLNVLHVATQYP